MARAELHDNRTPILAVHDVYDDFGLTLEAFRVLCHFARRAGLDKQIFPSYSSIGEVCFRGSYPNASVSTLKAKAIAAIKELISAGLVSKQSQKVGSEQTANRYFLNHQNLWAKEFLPDPESPNVRKGRAKGLKRERSIPVNPKTPPVNPTDHTPRFTPLTPPVNPTDHPVNGRGYEVVQSKDLQKEVIQFKTPLTPQGGNASEPFQNSQTESPADDIGNQQTPLTDQQPKDSGKAQKNKHSAAAKNQTSEQILALLPEAMQARFEKFWKGYSAFCDERQARAGAKKKAVVAWKFLVESDFNGKGLGGFEEGVRMFLKQQGDRTAGIPHASRFLYSTSNGSGAWEDAIDQASSHGRISDLAPGTSDRGNAPPIFVAPEVDESQYGPPPPGLREQYGIPKSHKPLRHPIKAKEISCA